MATFKHIVVFLFLFSISGGVLAQGPSTQMAPTTSEKLGNPISLSGICSEVKIIEWRDSGTENTKRNINNINAMKNYCNDAMNGFGKFIYSRGYKIKRVGKLHTSVCLMPVDSSPRNLNDVNFRFSNRTKTYNNGNVEIIWGYFQRYTNYIYVRNTVATSHKVVFVHELFHAASYYYDIYSQHPGNKDITEENLAQEFTVYIGYGR
ncbi:MAG: hypothetical protein Q8P20_00395 [bacterium]|nr:hypothetical protein [bacterium]